MEQRAAPAQALRTAPLAWLQQRAAAEAAQQRESLGIEVETAANGTTRLLATI